MTGFVLDASVALSWCFEDEATPEVDELLDALQTSIAWIPEHLWSLEVGNALLVGVRRRRYGVAMARRHWAFLGDLPLQPTSASVEACFRAASEQTKLTTYDAAYLALAIDLNCPLATLDRDLRAIAARAGVAIVPSAVA